MGGSQSQERVVSVEGREDEEPQIIITEDFLKHISSKQDKGSTSENIKRGSSEGIDSLPYAQSAEQLLIGEDYHRDGEYLSEDESNSWKRKFEFERRKNQGLKTLTSDAFDQAVSEIRERFVSKTSDNVIPVCEDCRTKVDSCYQRNSTKPLLCSSLVKEYIECVEKHRKGLLQAPSQVS